MPAVISGMSFNVAAGFLQFDAQRFMKDQKVAIINAMKSAAKVWLTTAMSRIPRETGFLHSGFRNLASFLGSRINQSGQIKRGRDLFGQQQKLDHLRQRRDILRDKAIARGYLEVRNRMGLGGSRGSRELKRVHPKPLSRKQRKERPKKYKAKQTKIKNRGSSRSAEEKAGILKEEGLSIHTKADNDEKKSLKIYKREKNKEFYEQQRERRAAERMLKQLKKLQERLRQQRLAVERAAQREKPFRTKESPGYDRWEKVTIEKTVYEEREVEELNPAYPHNNFRQQLAMKKAGTLPPKTIKVKKRVAVIIKKEVKRRITGERKLVDVYRKYYYPRNGHKGPLKTPFGGTEYGTPVDQIMRINEQSVPAGQIATETIQINKMGFEVSGKEIVSGSFDLNKSLSMAEAKINPNAKLIVSFNYKVDIRYLRIMDIFKPRRRDGKTYSGAPWQSIINANKAFMSILREEYQKIAPAFTSYVVVAKGTLKTPGFKGGL